MLELGTRAGVKRFFYSSSACIYPEYNQLDPDNPKCSEESAYPAAPDSEYGWEKLFSERLYLAYGEITVFKQNGALPQHLRARKGRGKVDAKRRPPRFAAKVAQAPNGGEIEIWGDGKQTRSFLFVDECVEAVRRLMESDFAGPVNVGSEEMVTINRLAELTAEIAGKKLSIRHIPGPLGVRGRNSDNHLIRARLGWAPSRPLREGLEKTYAWISRQVEQVPA